MKLFNSVAILTIAIASLSGFLTPVIAQTNQQEWVDFGQTNSGETLKLNERSIKFKIMLADDTLNNEDGFYDEGDNVRLPRIKVVVFDYSIGGRKRSAHTKSCQNGNMAANPSWKTYTSYRDYWPEYFVVEADSVASQKMLRRVCALSQYKQ